MTGFHTLVVSQSSVLYFHLEVVLDQPMISYMAIAIIQVLRYYVYAAMKDTPAIARSALKDLNVMDNFV